MSLPGITPPADASHVVASYATYAEAERAIDFLADHDFPVARVAVVAGDLRLVEQVTGRLGYGGAAARGAAAGATTGALLGFILGLLSLVAPLTSGLTLALVGLVVGGLVGALIGLIGHLALGGRRDFSSVSAVQAGRYDLIVAAEVAEHARQLLAAHARDAAARGRGRRAA